MARILVTGGAGFIGSNLTLALLNQNHEVVVVDDFSTGIPSNLDTLDVQVHSSSILNISTLENVLAKVDHIFHLAARGSVPRSLADPKGSIEINSFGTYQVLELARKLGIAITFSSSSSVYGRNLDSPKNETSWTSPLSPYAASKLSAEALVLSFGSSYSMPNKVFRFFNVFGPLQRPNHIYSAVIPKWIWSLMNGEPILLEGDGEQSRDFTFVGDVVKVLTQSLEKTDHSNQVVNLAFGNGLSLNEILQFLHQNYGETEVIKTKARIGDIKHSLNNPQVLKSLYPEISPTSFEEAIKTTINWLEENKVKIRNQPLTGD